MTAVAQAARNRVGHYLLLQKIDKGTMGTVYKGRHADTGREVVIKVMSERVAADVNLTMRFVRECKVAQALDHPHIVRVLDFGLDGSKAYLVMEHVEGESLAKRLERTGRLDEAEAVDVITQVGSALDWAHRLRLVHRNMKPAKILLGSDGRARLNDLGLIKDLENDALLTTPADILGTPNFMAPEQFDDAGKANAKSDLYSLAATLYMTVTGSAPFGPAAPLTALMRKKVANDLIPPRRLVPGLSAQVEAAILRGMRAHPDERQASVLDFLGELEDAVAAAAPGPAPAVPPEGERRRSKRHAARRRTSCRPLSRARGGRHWYGDVADISETGLCLQLERRFEPGTVLRLFFSGDADRRPVIVRIIWAKKESPEIWRLGGQFDRRLCGFEVDELRKTRQVELAKESPKL
jgi:serine/threonine protein kinase